jgi:DNA-binding CsgD family transcriptional regulator
MSSTQECKNFRDHIASQKSGESAFSALCDIVKSYGFDEIYYSYGALKNAPGLLNDLKLEKIIILQSSISDEREEYFKSDYNPNRKFEKDPSLLPFHYGRQNPFISGLGYVEEGLLKIDDSHMPFMQQSSDIMGSGSVILPVMTPETKRVPSGSLTVISNQTGHKLVKATTEMMRFLPKLVDLFIEKAVPLTTRTMQAEINLTAREKECLQYIANGFRTTDISEHLNRSKSMIDRHVASARIKLRARTLPEAVARALSHKIIEL